MTNLWEVALIPLPLYEFLVNHTQKHFTSTNTESNSTISIVFKLNETYSITVKELMEMSHTVVVIKSNL